MPYLAPNSTPVVIDDDALDDAFHDLMAGITGVSGSLVRPRWQATPPTQPDFTTDWIAFGVSVSDVDQFAYIGHDPAGNGGLGTNQVERDEVLKLQCSFYGPNCKTKMSLFRDGLQVDSNRFDLEALGVKFIEMQETINLPALMKERWVKRLDVTSIFRRRVKRVYSIPSLLGIPTQIDLDNEKYHVILPVPPST